MVQLPWLAVRNEEYILLQACWCENVLLLMLHRFILTSILMVQWLVDCADGFALCMFIVANWIRFVMFYKVYSCHDLCKLQGMHLVCMVVHGIMFNWSVCKVWCNNVGIDLCLADLLWNDSEFDHGNVCCKMVCLWLIEHGSLDVCYD